MPRQARVDAPGTLHHVVIRGIERGRIFQNDQDRNHFVFRLGNLSQEAETSIYAWSLMSNHAHMLLRSDTEGKSERSNSGGEGRDRGGVGERVWECLWQR